MLLWSIETQARRRESPGAIRVRRARAERKSSRRPGDGVGDLPPAGNLRRRVQTRRADVAYALRPNLGDVGDKEAPAEARLA
jgi:hypothetical protein